MSDKDKNPDFQIEIDDDELELNLEENIFDDTNKESDDLLTEEELENLIIGIDEENDILDIPDEEEVLEELKFFDESFTLPKDEPKEEKENTKPEKKAKVKKEKAPKAPKTPREPIDWQFFILKNKFKILGVFLLIVVLSFVLTFVLVLKSHSKVEETAVAITSESAITEEKQTETVVEETPKEEVTNLSPIDEEIKQLKEELNKETSESKKLELQKAILSLEEEKIYKTQEKKVEELKKYYDEVLPTVTTAVIKIEDDILVLALIVQNNNFNEELYKVLEKTFEDKYQINRVNISILKRTKNLNKIGELNLEQKKFAEISEKNMSIDEKIKNLGYQKR